jgi:hypothetical protein
MRHVFRLTVILSITAALVSSAGGQIDSHCVPAEWPAQLFPNWITKLPTVESQEVAAPLLSDAAKSRKAKAAGGQDRPDATNLVEMCKDPREAIRMAEGGRFLEAAKAGDALLEGPREKYRDFTWDYLANATAWSFLQCGDLAGATRSHINAAARIDDPAVSEYHSRIAKMLSSPGRVAAPLKDYAAYKAEVQKVINERVEALKKVAQPSQKIVLDEIRLARLRDAYVILRVLAAFDQAVAKQEIQNTYVPAAQGLVNDVLPAELEEGTKIQKAMNDRMKTFISGREFDEWNTAVATLRLKVREIKRLCRMHDYLVRMELAKAGGADRFFGEAHRLLFCVNDAGKVWPEVGHAIVVDGVMHVDIRIKVPYPETIITPMGVPFSGKLATPENVWKPVDDKMRVMDGRMHGGMTPMTNPLKK